MVVILQGILNVVIGLSRYAVFVWEFISGIGPFIVRFLEWVILCVTKLPVIIFADFLEAILLVITFIFSLACCRFISTFIDSSYIASYAVSYFLDFFRFGYGLVIIVCALCIRFLIRRLPFVG